MVKSMANDEFSEPPQCADSRNPIFCFADFFLGLGHLRGPGISLVRIWRGGGGAIEPLFGGGGGV